MSITIGIIGVGGMANYHVPDFRQSGAEVVALCDVNEDAAQKGAARQGIDRVVADVGDMSKGMPELEAVSVIVPKQVPCARHPAAHGRLHTRDLREVVRAQREADGPDARRREEGEAHADVQLQQPCPARDLRHDGRHRGRRRWHDQNLQVQVDPMAPASRSLFDAVLW